MAASPDDMSFLDRLGVLTSGLDKKLQPFGGAANLGAALLANSGYSTTPRNFGQVLGASVLQGQQLASQRQNDQLRNQYLQAQIEAMRAKPAATPFGDINPSQYVPESVAQFQRSVAAGTPDYSLLRYNEKTAETPSNVREYEYYKSLLENDKKNGTNTAQQYLEVKRSLNPFSAVNYMGGLGAMDRRTGEVVQKSTAEQEATGQSMVAGAKSAAEETGKKTSDAMYDLPRVERTVQQAVGDIEKLKNHPGLQYITGVSSKVPIIPGTSQAAAQALADQVKGQTFLQAYQSLKGGGAITEVEGKKAEAAIARLNQAQSTADYKAALDDLATVLQSGLTQAKKQAGKSGDGAPKRTAPQAAIDYLKSHPEAAGQFRAKYGYLP